MGIHSSDLPFSPFKYNQVKDDDSSVRFPGISDSCRSAAKPLPVVDSQQRPSSFHQPMVSVEHTSIAIRIAHILYRISLPQDQVIPLRSYAELLHLSACPLWGRRTSEASAQDSFCAAPGRSMPPSSLRHLCRHCRSLSSQPRPVPQFSLTMLPLAPRTGCRFHRIVTETYVDDGP